MSRIDSVPIRALVKEYYGWVERLTQDNELPVGSPEKLKTKEILQIRQTLNELRVAIKDIVESRPKMRKMLLRGNAAAGVPTMTTGEIKRSSFSDGTR